MNKRKRDQLFIGFLDSRLSYYSLFELETHYNSAIACHRVRGFWLVRPHHGGGRGWFRVVAWRLRYADVAGVVLYFTIATWYLNL